MMIMNKFSTRMVSSRRRTTFIRNFTDSQCDGYWNCLNRLSLTESANLEGPLQYNEVYGALQKMKNNKSPGTAGFTVEFYKFFWKDICHLLKRSLSYGYNEKQLSVTQRHGVVLLIPKGDKPRNV